jgi:imidazolonepropionase
MSYRCRIRNAAQIVLVSRDFQRVKCGAEQNKIEIIKNGTLIIDNDGLISDIGTEDILSNKYQGAKFDLDVDATGKSVIPGLVDGHTHPVWTGDRTHEFVMKLQGAKYLDIHKQGGGIGFTVRHVRQSSEEELSKLLRKRLKTMISNGSTLVECKSGYGLDCENEIKMLKVIHSVKGDDLPDTVANYLGGHSVPKDSGKTLDSYTKEILEEHIPQIKKLKQEGVISPTLIDVFHEAGVFETEQTRKILLAGKDAGLHINFHGDELHPMKSAELAKEVGAIAVSHLECISDQGIQDMASAQIVATLLPTTAYVLRIEYPPARKLIDSGVPVALASDFNPNAHCMSLPFVMNLACVQMRMSLNEALVACTINAAASLGKHETHGSLEVGKVGDCVIIDYDNWEHIIYEIGNSPIHSVIKNGRKVV